MQHFTEDEFQGWYDKLSPKLKTKLDQLRDLWNKPIYVSKSPGAVGRTLGYNDLTRHNYTFYGEVQAIDIMPEGLENVSDAYLFFDLCAQVGFGGIGFYPEWEPHAGFHVDVRPIKNGRIETWGKVDGKYVGITVAFDSVT